MDDTDFDRMSYEQIRGLIERSKKLPTEKLMLKHLQSFQRMKPFLRGIIAGYISRSLDNADLGLPPDAQEEVQLWLRKLAIILLSASYGEAAQEQEGRGLEKSI